MPLPPFQAGSSSSPPWRLPSPLDLQQLLQSTPSRRSPTRYGGPSASQAGEAGAGDIQHSTRQQQQQGAEGGGRQQSKAGMGMGTEVARDAQRGGLGGSLALSAGQASRKGQQQQAAATSAAAPSSRSLPSSPTLHTSSGSDPAVSRPSPALPPTLETAWRYRQVLSQRSPAHHPPHPFAARHTAQGAPAPFIGSGTGIAPLPVTGPTLSGASLQQLRDRTRELHRVLLQQQGQGRYPQLQEQGQEPAWAHGPTGAPSHAYTMQAALPTSQGVGAAAPLLQQGWRLQHTGAGGSGQAGQQPQLEAAQIYPASTTYKDHVHTSSPLPMPHPIPAGALHPWLANPTMDHSGGGVASAHPDMQQQQQYLPSSSLYNEGGGGPLGARSSSMHIHVHPGLVAGPIHMLQPTDGWPRAPPSLLTVPVSYPGMARMPHEVAPPDTLHTRALQQPPTTLSSLAAQDSESFSVASISNTITAQWQQQQQAAGQDGTAGIDHNHGSDLWGTGHRGEAEKNRAWSELGYSESAPTAALQPPPTSPRMLSMQLQLQQPARGHLRLHDGGRTGPDQDQGLGLGLALDAIRSVRMSMEVNPASSVHASLASTTLGQQPSLGQQPWQQQAAGAGPPDWPGSHGWQAWDPNVNPDYVSHRRDMQHAMIMQTPEAQTKHTTYRLAQVQQHSTASTVAQPGAGGREAPPYPWGGGGGLSRCPCSRCPSTRPCPNMLQGAGWCRGRRQSWGCKRCRGRMWT